MNLAEIWDTLQKHYLKWQGLGNTENSLMMCAWFAYYKYKGGKKSFFPKSHSSTTKGEENWTTIFKGLVLADMFYFSLLKEVSKINEFKDTNSASILTFGLKAVEDFVYKGFVEINDMKVIKGEVSALVTFHTKMGTSSTICYRLYDKPSTLDFCKHLAWISYWGNAFSFSNNVSQQEIEKSCTQVLNTIR